MIRKRRIANPRLPRRASNPGVFVAFVPGGPIYGVSWSEDGARREGETYYPGDRKALRVAPATDALVAFLRQNLDTADAHEYVVGAGGADVARPSPAPGDKKRASNPSWPSLSREDVRAVKHVCQKARVAGKPELVKLSFGIVEVDPRGLVGDPKGDDVYGQVQGDGWYAWSPPDEEDDEARSKAEWASGTNSRTSNPAVPGVDDVTLMQLTHSKDAARAYRKLGAMLGKPMVFLLGNGVKILFSNKAPRPNLVQIELTPADTYRVSFGRKGKDVFSKVINDVYAESLREIFERETGLYLSV